MIVRTRRRVGWVVLPNSVLERDNLSWKAKGLLAYLLSRPDNWEVRESHLAQMGADGRDAVRSGLKELIDAGLMIRRQVRAANGQLHWLSYVSDEPMFDFPSTAEPMWDLPTSEKPTVISTDIDMIDTREGPDENLKELVRLYEGKAALPISRTLADDFVELVAAYGFEDVRAALAESLDRVKAPNRKYIEKVVLSKRDRSGAVSPQPSGPVVVAPFADEEEW